jgi:hypothetical protein
LAAPDVYPSPNDEDWGGDPEEWTSWELVAVAKWAGVAAWELMNKPAWFFEQYRAAMWIENKARAEAMRSK